MLPNNDPGKPSTGPLGFAEEQAVFDSPTQNVRALSEHWFHHNMYCLACGEQAIQRVKANEPVLDFTCGSCAEPYELKAKKGLFGNRIVNGAYAAMTKRLRDDNNPNLALMTYDKTRSSVVSLIVVPKCYFTIELIERRKPLAPTARRAGWIGCNIHLGRVPDWGRVPVILSGSFQPKDEVLATWRRVSFLNEKPGRTRSWLVDVMKCIEKLGTAQFSLEQVYQYESVLKESYPRNENVKPKIRQQLQLLRDAGLVEFLGRGHYRLTESWLARR